MKIKAWGIIKLQIKRNKKKIFMNRVIWDKGFWRNQNLEKKWNENEYEQFKLIPFRSDVSFDWALARSPFKGWSQS